MKKTLIRITLILFILIFAYTVFNQFDIAEVNGEFTGKTAADVLGRPDYSKENGFYRLLSLDEPEDTDVESDDIYMKYRSLYDPQYNNKKFSMEFKRKKQNDYLEKFDNFIKNHKNAKEWFFRTSSGNIGKCNNILKDREDVLKLKTLSLRHLERYQSLINSEKYEDITVSYDWGILPNLLLWIKLGEVYNTMCTLDAMEGNWERGINSLLKHLSFLKKSAKTNRILMTHLINSAMLKFTITSVNNLLNHKNCPVKMSELILKLPDLTSDEYSSERALISELVFGPSGRMFYEGRFDDKVSGLKASFARLFIQKNSTISLYDQKIKEILEFLRTPPYLQKKNFSEVLKSKKKFFWWLRNPVGVKLAETFISISAPNIQWIRGVNHEIKALYDMLKISAELRIKYSENLSVIQNLRKLDSYSRLKDLCSNSPYKWNEKAQTLYSVGTDREDNSGLPDLKNFIRKDYILPVILYVK